MEDENFLEMVGLLDSREGPLGLCGMEERGGVEVHEPQQGHHRGCVRTGDLVKQRPLMTDQEAGARTVVEEVWFWDKSLQEETETTS